MCVMLGVGLGYYFLTTPAVVSVANGDGSLRYAGYEIRSLQPFTLQARVLSRKNYASGREAQLSKLDLALGWGAMAQPEVIAQLDISQRNRWYFWSAKRLPIPKRQIETQSANMHIIAGSESVARQLERVRANDNVVLDGDLVEVVGEDGWRWRSSLSREDTGNGSCEVVLVHALRVI